jgi:chromosome segregation ATPase
MIEKKTQTTMQASQERNRAATELAELKEHMDIKDRKINVLQRKIENLEDLLKEKDNQVDMARARLTAMQAHHCSSEGALTSLEEQIGDKEKQMMQLRYGSTGYCKNCSMLKSKPPYHRDQRDRAEAEKIEERELHEREIAEYKMKLHSYESEVDKLTSRLHRALAEKDRLESKLENSQTELGKSKVELEKAATDIGRIGSWENTNQKIQRLEVENERLRGELERSQVRLPVSIIPSIQFNVIIPYTLKFYRPHLAAIHCPHPRNWIVYKSVLTRPQPNSAELRQN